ncbi:MAG: hypothetical protein IPP13_14495 [Kouleothrix sp.]|jgi:hypothetical protein|nr:hypothetical protein [Kouleothrix sp.]
MSDESISDVDLRKAIRQASRRLDQKSEAERRTLIQQAVEQAMNEELAEKRLENERVAEIVGEEIGRDPVKEAMAAREQAKSAALLLTMLLLILWLIAAATGRTDILRFTNAPQALPTLQPRLSDQSSSVDVASVPNRPGTTMPGIGSLEQPNAAISPIFQAYYAEHGGERVFGKVISPELNANGRRFQWFERARLEDWPEHSNTPYVVQGGLLGYEFTRGLTFPQQTYFISQPSARFFPETGHGVADRFLQFWNEIDGMRVLGFPISEQVQEMLPDKQIYTVQYFERGRIEYHPQQAGTPFEMQLGLLGRALYLKESTPNIIPPPRPTSVPLP